LAYHGVPVDQRRGVVRYVFECDEFAGW